MRYWGIVGAIAAALFVGGRLVGRAQARSGSSTEAHAVEQHEATTPAQSAAIARHATVQKLVDRLARAPSRVAAVAAPTGDVERSTAEPPDATRARRERVAAEIDQRAPGLPEAKRTLLLAEADRLAWNKRELRADFLLGKLSETEYVDALKDDIRTSLATFEDALTDAEYTALFNRVRGSDADPFTLESLVGRAPPKQ